MVLRESSVGQIADLLKDEAAPGPKACLLIGAGVSKTAGIGLAEDYVARIKNSYPAVYEAICAVLPRGKKPGYADCMAALPPAKQVQLVRADIDRAKINWAHIGIARLEAAEVIDSILTPNFDPLASRACALFHRFPAIYDLAGLRDDRADHIDFDRSYVRGSAIFHLHGQHTGFLLLNTQDKLERQAKRIRPVLDAAMKGKPVVVAGYSGGNDPLVAEIAALAPFNHGLFWIAHDGNDPAPRVCEQLLSQPNCYLVRNMPADRFFTDLANNLKLDAPKFMFNPFEHMLGVLATIECYAQDGSSPQDNLLHQAKTKLQAATKSITQNDQSVTEITELMSAGQYDEVWARFSTIADDLNDDDRDQLLWAGVVIADRLADRAKTAHGKKADDLFSEALEMYNAAFKVSDDRSWLFNNWGMTLSDQAQRKSGADASKIFDEARKKYLKAEELSPGSSIYNLACLSALQGDAASASDLLLKSKETGHFPGCNHIHSDTDFALVRETPEFLRAMIAIGCVRKPRKSKRKMTEDGKIESVTK